MTIYLVQICFIIILGLWINPWRSLQRKKIFLILSFLILVFISGFRNSSVGTDTIHYINAFNNINVMNFLLSHFENGFLLYTKVIRNISDDPTLFLFISSTICIGSTCVFIYKFSEDPLLSILLYIVLKPYFFQMTGMRQALATAITVFAFQLILEKITRPRIFFSFVLMIIATQFHNMAFVAFIPYIMWLFPKVRYNTGINAVTVFKWTIIISIIVFAFYMIVMRIVQSVATKYNNYFNGTWSDSNYSASFIKMLIQLAFLIVGVMYLKREELVPIERFSFIMICISVVVCTLSMRMEIWGRLSGLFSIYTGILFAPNICARIKQINNRLLVKTSIFLFSFLYMLITFILRPEWDGVVPYLFK